MQRNVKPVTWPARGASDTLDGAGVTGAMSSLSNLIPDPTTKDLWQCRPAAVPLPNSAAGAFSSGFSSGFLITGLIPSPGFISALKVSGSYVYGMIASSLNPGFDQPFVYDLIAGTYITVSGIVSSNVPLSPPTSGAWTPPSIDVVGSKVLVTHPGFGGTTNFFGWFDISTLASPVWHAGNLTGAITFTTIPNFVAQFSNRAYFLVNTPSQPAAVISDPLNPTNVTNASQVLTFGDVVPLTAIGQLRLYNQLGGIVQGLVVFKGVGNSFQITGDPALNNLTVNALNVATGTLSPLGITTTKQGIAFISPEGLRIIDYNSNVSDPIGIDGDGICLPFINCPTPSRSNISASGNIVRCSVQNANALGTPFQEWWYDIARQKWSGPHTFPADQIDTYDNTFITAPIGVHGQLFRSDVVQNNLSSFVENGVQLMWGYQTANFPQAEEISNYALSMSAVDLALSSSGPPINVSMIDPNGLVLDTVQINLSGTAAIWDQFSWGATTWGAARSALLPRQIPWHRPLVFAKASLIATGQSNSTLRIGALKLRLKTLRYLVDIGAVA